MTNAGKTALMMASANGYLEIVTLLFQAGADVNSTSNKGSTAVLLASSNGHAKIVKYLIKVGAQGNIESKSNVFSPSTNYIATLAGALSNSHLEIAKMLIEAGADVNHTMKGGWSPLMAAVSKSRSGKRVWLNGNKVEKPNDNTEKVSQDHFDCVQLVIDSGADVNKVNTGGWTALMMASLDGRLDIVHLLLDSGASVNVTCDFG